MSDSVKIRYDRSTMVISMCRPERRNALDPQMREGLAAAIDQARTDHSVRAVVLAGTERAFCAGGDIRGMEQAAAGKRDVFEGRQRILDMNRWFADLAQLEKPVIAAVEGAAFGAGLSLTLAADYVLASAEATFCAVFARIGYVPDLASMYLLPRVVGLRSAKDLVFTARTVGVDEARDLGLVQQIETGDVVSAAVALTHRFASAPAEAIGIAKTVMNRAFETDRQAVEQLEALAQAVCRESDYHRDAVQRFSSRQELRHVW